MTPAGVSDISIRPATAADAEEITRIEIQSKRESFGGDRLEPYETDVAARTERWRGYITDGSTAQMALGDGWVLIAEVDGEPVGYAAYHHTRRHGTQSELQSIYVLKSAQGQGIGTRLVREIATRFSADGTRSMCVGYSSDNPYRRFYAKLGAVEINTSWAVWESIDDLTGSVQGAARSVPKVE